MTTETANRLAEVADLEGLTPAAVTHFDDLLVKYGLQVDDEVIATANRIFREQIEATMSRSSAREVDTTAEKPTAERQTKKVFRGKIFGFSVTSVLRWMGMRGYSFEEAAVAMATLGCAKISDSTIRIQLNAGRQKKRGAPAKLSEGQAKKIHEATL